MTRQIAGATATVAVTTALVAFVSIPRELLIAAQFGTGEAADAFLVALVVPTFVLGVLGGSVASAFIPAYLRVSERDGPGAGDQLLRELSTVLLGLLCLVSVIVGLISPYVLRVIASGFSGSKLALTQQVLFALLITVPLGGISALWAAVLNAKGAFAIPSLSQGIIPIAGICALLLFPGAGIAALTAGMVIGFALRTVILVWALRSRGVAFLPTWSGSSEDLRSVGRQYAPMAAASVLMGGTILVDQAVAASLGPGSVATLGYGLKFITLATSLGSLALGTAVLPFLSRMVATKNWSELRSTVRTFSLLALLATLPVAVIASIYAAPLVSVLYERGAFSSSDTIAVAQILALGVWQLPFFAVGTVFSRLVSSLGANQLLLIQAAMVLGLDIVLDVTLARYAGVAGIALATTLMYAASLVFLVVASRIAIRRAR
ncbi:MAG: MATE family efflux transporter [Chloroflexota bacterium]|nr:MATE family efflux transporter [Chloroflexota bacterium]